MENKELETVNDEMVEEMIDEMVIEERPKTKFAKGMIIGIISGILLSAIVAVITINIVQNVSGYPILLDNGGMHIYTNPTIIDEDAAKKTDEIMKTINFYYDGTYDEDDLRDGIYHAIVNGLGDKYATYMTKEEYAAFQDSSAGVFYGIGAQLKKDTTTGSVTITKVFKNSPAEEAGLAVDDIIIGVDGYQAVEYDLTTFVNFIKGEENTTVELEIYRPFTEETFKVTATRRKIDSPSVDAKMLETGIGYIQIAEFQDKTFAQFKAAYTELEDQGMEKLVIDLRDNPGGLLSSVIEILDMVLPEGNIVSVTNKYGKSQRFDSDKSCIKVDLVVLVNGNSASASEIFAGAIRDYKYGTLIGTKTYGKGIVQSILPLKDGDAIKLTTAKYYTPNGSNIHGIGIEPDILLEYEKQTEYTVENDNQIQKAIEVLKNK